MIYTCSHPWSTRCFETWRASIRHEGVGACTGKRRTRRRASRVGTTSVRCVITRDASSCIRQGRTRVRNICTHTRRVAQLFIIHEREEIHEIQKVVERGLHHVAVVVALRDGVGVHDHEETEQESTELLRIHAGEEPGREETEERDEHEGVHLTEVETHGGADEAHDGESHEHADDLLEDFTRWTVRGQKGP